MRKVGLLGGTFDPPHLGHLLMAENALRSLGLSHIYFVPSGDSHWKSDVTRVEHRVRMTELAVMDNPRFSVSYVDVGRHHQPTYTVDTLEALAEEEPDTQFHFLVGQDNIEGLNGWNDIERCLDLAIFAMAKRGDDTVDIPAEFSGRVETFDTMVTGISSSTIRGYIPEGYSIRYVVPPAVERYIREHFLYTH